MLPVGVGLPVKCEELPRLCHGICKERHVLKCADRRESDTLEQFASKQKTRITIGYLVFPKLDNAKMGESHLGIGLRAQLLNPREVIRKVNKASTGNHAVRCGQSAIEKLEDVLIRILVVRIHERNAFPRRHVHTAVSGRPRAGVLLRHDLDTRILCGIGDENRR